MFRPDYKADQKQLFENRGFADNTRRGTAHLFSNEALTNFLIKNNLSYVVRAHEVQQVGFKVKLVYFDSFKLKVFLTGPIRW